MEFTFMSTDSEATGRCKVVYHADLLFVVLFKKSCFPCFKEEDVLWLNWKSNSKTKSPFVVFYVFASVYNMEMLAVGSAAGLSAEPVLSTGESSASAHMLSVPGNASCWLPSSSPSTATTRPFSCQWVCSQSEIFMGAPSIFQPVVIFLF